MRVARTILAAISTAALTTVPLTANAQEEPGQFAFEPVYSTYASIWNFWNNSNTVGSTAGVPKGVKFEGVAWDYSTTTYNNSYPGVQQVQLCTVTPVQCFPLPATSGWTDAFNNLDVATTKFYFKYRYYNPSKPDNTTRYDALIGTGIKPLMQGSIGAWWTPPTATTATTNKLSPSLNAQLK